MADPKERSQEDEDAAIAKIRAGEPLSYAYDVYGTGRVWYTIRWDPEAERFVEWHKEQDLGGQVFEGETPIQEDAARRHVRGSWYD